MEAGIVRRWCDRLAASPPLLWLYVRHEIFNICPAILSIFYLSLSSFEWVETSLPGLTFHNLALNFNFTLIMLDKSWRIMNVLILSLRSLMYYSNSSWSNLLIGRGKKGESLAAIFGTLFYTMGGEKSRLWNFCTTPAIHVHYYWNYKKLCYYKLHYQAPF